jgi:asparagine synthase (glutamine-hydrolysing)
LEARTPFLDKGFVQSYLTIPDRIRNHGNNEVCEKFILRKAFEDMNILPKEVLFRTKEAFSDGISKSTRSWFQIIQEFAAKKYAEPNMKKAEQKYYDEIFYDRFTNKDCLSYSNKYDLLSKVAPYKWMPRFVNATDSSARTLKIYNSVNNNNIVPRSDTLEQWQFENAIAVSLEQ